ADLAALFGRAFGTTTSAQLAQTWNLQNGYLVDYAIGVVTHNDAKANGAMSGLTNGFVPQFAQLISAASRMPLDPVTQLTSQQVLEDKGFIDDLFAGHYATYYADLHRAYAQTSRFGDALAAQIAQDFPDKFPGDPSAHRPASQLRPWPRFPSGRSRGDRASPAPRRRPQDCRRTCCRASQAASSSAQHVR